MKAFLMHRDKDFDLDREPPPQERELTQDLGLDGLFAGMAQGDQFLREVARKAVLSSLNDPQEIVYRQQILGDCVGHAAVIGEMYALAVAAIEGERKVFRTYLQLPDSVLHTSIEALELFVVLLKKLRRVADEQAATFRSEGFVAFFAMLGTELADAYFRSVEDHLQQLRFRHGTLISARLGKGNKGIDYILRASRSTKSGWRQWLTRDDQSAYTLVIGERDISGAQALAELRSRGISLAANALAQSADHILRFFRMLRAELGFYLGCLNLRRQLAEKGEPVCFPVPLAPGRPALACRGLYDVGLSLRLAGRVVGNDVSADNKRLILITGANQGGKSTFLRSIGLAQLMMQGGMFVAAEAFRADVCEALFTHYRREEDPTMTSGKLDEELSRMSDIVDRVRQGGMVLLNESFAATNEKEGAEIASAIVRALPEAGIKVIFVTHSFELALRLYRQGLDDAFFLRAERQVDGGRTFRLAEGEPLPTSYGADLYRKIFGEAPDVASAAPRMRGQEESLGPGPDEPPVARDQPRG